MEETVALHFHSPFSFLSDKTFEILVMIFIDYFIIFFIAVLGSIGAKLKPKKVQNLVEWGTKYICNYADEIIGKDAPIYYPLLVILFYFIFIGNLMGLIPGLVSPTSTLSVTVALAIIVFFYEHIAGIKKKGVVNYFKHFAGEGIPGWLKPFMFFIELISELSRPLSLSFRLFGNILAKEVLLGVLALLTILFFPKPDVISKMLFSVSGILRPLIIVLGVLVSIIQAGVFTLLAAIYIAGAVKTHEEH